MTTQRRPWCLPCRDQDGSEGWAEHLGVVCDWHWGILSPAEQEELRQAVLARHPRGGRVTRVTEQIGVVRRDLRNAGSTIEQTWAREWAQHQRDTAE